MKHLDLSGMEQTELRGLAERLGEKRFRGTQVFQWIHQKRATSLEQMVNIGAGAREAFGSAGRLTRLEIKDARLSEDGSHKYLLLLEDGQAVETVLIPHNYGQSLCISSQAGCRMACGFCASATGGLVRDLTTAEIVGQVLRIQHLLDPSGQRVGRLDFMGTGEPLDNYDNVVKAIRIMTDPSGLAIGARRMTISTCGLAPEIHRLAREGLQVTLSVSLHAPNDALRSSLMPVNRRYPIKQVLEACDEYSKMTGRRVTYEYALIDRVNDSPAMARDLARLVRGRLAHVNLIPLNAVPGRSYKRSGKDAVGRFMQELERSQVAVSLRREMGSTIEAACGQLRRREIDAAGRQIRERPVKTDQ